MSSFKQIWSWVEHVHTAVWLIGIIGASLAAIVAILNFLVLHAASMWLWIGVWFLLSLSAVLVSGWSRRRQATAPLAPPTEIATLSPYERALLSGHGPRGAFWTQWTRGGMWVQSDAAQFGEVGNQPLQLQYVEALDQLVARGLMKKHSETSWSMTLEGWTVAHVLQAPVASTGADADSPAVLPEPSVIDEAERLVGNGELVSVIVVDRVTQDNVQNIQVAYWELRTWLAGRASQFESSIREKLGNCVKLLLAEMGSAELIRRHIEHSEPYHADAINYYHNQGEYMGLRKEIVDHLHELRKQRLRRP